MALLIYVGIVIITVYTGWIFYLDDQNVYGRGPLYFVQIVCSFGYLLCSTTLALRKAFSVQSATERKEFYSLSSFVAFPIAAAISQIFFYGLSEISIMMVVSELLIFINVQNKQIATDALTCINNRGQFNRYLGVRIRDLHGDNKLFMILIDIDKFKAINDTFGHDVGDSALIDTADILKQICGKNNGFLARYGGDEFAIVLECKSEIAVQKLIQEIKENFEKFNQINKRIYKIELSIGYAEFGKENIATMEQLIGAADDKMYQMKQQEHA